MKTFNLAAMLMLLMVCNVKAQNDSVKQLKDQTLQEVEVVTTRPECGNYHQQRTD